MHGYVLYGACVGAAPAGIASKINTIAIDRSYAIQL